MVSCILTGTDGLRWVEGKERQTTEHARILKRRLVYSRCHPGRWRLKETAAAGVYF